MVKLLPIHSFDFALLFHFGFLYLTSHFCLFICTYQPPFCLSACKHIWFHMPLLSSSWYTLKPALSFVPVWISVWPPAWLNIHPCSSVRFACLLLWPFPSPVLLFCPPVCLLSLSASLRNRRPVYRSANLSICLPMTISQSSAANFTDPFTCQPNSPIVYFSLSHKQTLITPHMGRFVRFYWRQNLTATCFLSKDTHTACTSLDAHRQNSFIIHVHWFIRTMTSAFSLLQSKEMTFKERNSLQSKPFRFQCILIPGCLLLPFSVAAGITANHITVCFSAPP